MPRSTSGTGEDVVDEASLAHDVTLPGVLPFGLESVTTSSSTT